MVIVSLTEKTHSLLKKVKLKMKNKNSRVFKVNNDIVINHALKKIEDGEDFEISPIN